MDIKIPKKIHFIWYGGEIPWYILYYITLTRQMYKGYKIKIWGPNDFDPSTRKYTKKAFEEKKYAFVSDYLRAKILFEEGGIYLDTDMVPIKNIEPYLKHKVILGFEYVKMATTGFVAAAPGHPLFKRILDTYNQFDYLENDFKFIVNNELWTLILSEIYDLKLSDKTQLLAGDIKIYPHTYFSTTRITRDSVFLHDHKLSWTTPLKAKSMNYFLDKIRTYSGSFLIPLSIMSISSFRKNKKRLKKLNKAEEKTIDLLEYEK